MCMHMCIFALLLLFSCPVMSNSATTWLQHARPSCPSPSPKVCPSSYQLHQWSHLAISSSDTLFFCSQSFPASRTFPMSQLFTSDDQNIGASAPASVLARSIQGWFPLRLTGLTSVLSKSLPQHNSSKPSIHKVDRATNGKLPSWDIGAHSLMLTHWGSPWPSAPRCGSWTELHGASQWTRKLLRSSTVPSPARLGLETETHSVSVPGGWRSKSTVSVGWFLLDMPKGKQHASLPDHRPHMSKSPAAFREQTHRHLRSEKRIKPPQRKNRDRTSAKVKSYHQVSFL